MTKVPPPPVPAQALEEVERPGRTEGASARPDLDTQAPRAFPCPQCGADFEYHIGHLQLKCPHCGHTEPIDLDDEAPIEERDYSATLERLQKQHEDGGPQGDGLDEAQAVECASCGAEIVFVGTLTSTRCAYCGTPIQRERIHTAPHRIPVDAVLPFEVDRDGARAALDGWVKGRWFAPTKFVERKIREGLNAVYLPYWTFDALTFTQYTGLRGEHYRKQVGSGKNRRTVTKTRWRPAGGSFQRFFDDVLAFAAQAVHRPLLLLLEPWPLERLQPFRAEFLAGIQARTYDTPLDQGFEEARGRVDAALRGEVHARIGGDAQQITSMDVRYDAIQYKHLLLPIWLLAYRHKDKLYNVVINATTGEVHGERPYSATKIGCLVAFVLALVALVFVLRAF